LPRLVALVLVLLYATPGVAETWRLETVGILAGMDRLFRDAETRSVKVRANDRYFRISKSGDELTLLRSSGPAPQDRPEDAIPHSRVVGGSNDITTAWLADGTDRYAHGVLGDTIEAAALKVRTVAGKTASFTVRSDSVLEDLIPRLVDVDGDGRDEIIVVRSHKDAGAAVVLLGLRGNRLVRLAESVAIGTSNRWLNPIGAADFDGDGQAEVAVVETPHIGGKLLLLKIDGRRLREVGRYAGYSTHIIGSTELGMFAVTDINGDGAPEIILPTQDRKELRAISFAGGKLVVLAVAKLFRPVTTAILAEDVDGNGTPDILFGDQGGYLNIIRR
jgi:FG-GAP-like repeat